jgi:NAD(P)-dependent dehydrogenase (short-subunit alcohol dehydrogenase family)
MDNKTVVITGCSSGIGAATARAFAREEWQTFATARDPDDLAALDGCETLELDVTDPEQVDAVVAEVVERDGRIDAVVNNAGYGQHGPLEDVPEDLLHRQFDVNVYGPHRLTRAALPHMREQGDGTVVNVSSLAPYLVAPGMGAYSGTKAALNAMSAALRREVEPFGVDVVTVEPGPVETPFRDRVDDEMDRLPRTDAYEDVYDFQEDASLLGGDSPFAVPAEEVADVIVEAAIVPDPDPRYPVGPIARWVLLASHLPERWRDLAFRLVRKVTT